MSGAKCKQAVTMIRQSLKQLFEACHIITTARKWKISHVNCYTCINQKMMNVFKDFWIYMTSWLHSYMTSGKTLRECWFSSCDWFRNRNTQNRLFRCGWKRAHPNVWNAGTWSKDGILNKSKYFLKSVLYMINDSEKISQNLSSIWTIATR